MTLATALASSLLAALTGAALCYLASPHQLARAVPWRAPAGLARAGLLVMALALLPLVAAASLAVACFIWMVWLMLGLTLAPLAGVALARRRAAREGA